MNRLRRAAQDIHSPDLDHILQTLQTAQSGRDIELDRVERNLSDTHVRHRSRLTLELERQRLALRQIAIYAHCGVSVRIRQEGTT